MPTLTTSPFAAHRRVRILAPGERALAQIEVAASVILVACLAVNTFLTNRVTEQRATDRQAAQVKAIGPLLRDAAQQFLAANDLVGLRRSVVESAASLKLTECRVSLGGDRIVADAKPSRINVPVLPARWTYSAETDADAPGAMRLAFAVKGRGTCVIDFAAARDVAGMGSSEPAIVCAAGLIASVVVYRRTRRTLAEMEVVRGALAEFEKGETDPVALKVDARLGGTAGAWNGCVDELADLRRRTMAGALTAVAGERRSGGNNLEAACDAMSQGLILIDDKMLVRFANGAARNFFRLDCAALAGAAASSITSDAKFQAAINSVAGGGLRRPVTIELDQPAEPGPPGEPALPADGGVLRVCIRPVRRGDADSAMIIIEDITQHRTAERSRNSFINQVTHELRTPLTNIRLYTETAIDDGDADPVVRANCLNVINQEARRLERIVGEMLSVAEMEAGSSALHQDEVYVDALVKDLETDYRAQAEEKHVGLEFKVAPKLPKIVADKDKLTIVMHNLIGNALKYTPEGGKVTISVDVRDDHLAVDVADTGIGIKPEETEKIFDRFFRSGDPRVGKIVGTGLGLTLAREVMRLHGGDVTVQSEMNRGSTFSATLPLNAAA